VTGELNAVGCSETELRLAPELKEEAALCEQTRGQHTLREADAYAESPGDLDLAHPSSGQSPDSLLDCRWCSRSRWGFVLRSGPFQPRFDPLLNDWAFKLGEAAAHLKHCSPGGRRRVEGLRVEVEVHPFGLKIGARRYIVRVSWDDRRTFATPQHSTRTRSARRAGVVVDAN
jgi:hypothetical protein